jgi:hypothetical protein
MSRTQRDTGRDQTGRSKRRPLGMQTLQLDARHLVPAGKVGRWINDDPGRLRAAEEAGYTYVVDKDAHVGEGPENTLDQLSSRVRKTVGHRANGSAKHGYLMVIDRALYEEDAQTKEAERKQAIEAMRRGNGDAGGMGADGRYVPQEGIRIDDGNKTTETTD